MKKLVMTVLAFALTLVCATVQAESPAPPVQPAGGQGADQPRKGMSPHMGGQMREKMGERMEKHFRKMDANNDGKVTLEEMQANTKQMFEKMDAGHDGGVSLEEMRKHHETMRQEMKAMHGADGMQHGKDNSGGKPE
jgi:Ca2+-binding EF-hand superfamily protein